jgi:hypothetical protein
MCTVTFIPGSGSICLVSNRDEKKFRADALQPAEYVVNGVRLLYPRDADAGGTWIALHENGTAVVLLNGGLQAHEPTPPYQKSRGIILLEMISSAKPTSYFDQTDLRGIEPFTAVVWEQHMLFECIWEGSGKHINPRDREKSHIWSSVTLYDESIRRKRESWFREWLTVYPAPTLDEILDFHRFTGDGDSHNDLLMNRNGEVFTVSITGMEICKDRGMMEYLDMKNMRRSYTGLRFTEPQLRQGV